MRKNPLTNSIGCTCTSSLNQTTSAVIEKINNKNKLIKRRDYGFASFNSFLIGLLG
ncbi:transposase [Altericista sp. CCNU0014]|uniref:transposase n=1 Tax=Altericista sp. CCNU0014 TaxID=3082949 RepID=UPI00384B7BFC